MQKHIIEGVFKTFPKNEDFDLELNLIRTSLKIRGLNKKLLIEKKAELEKEHAIYILEGPNTCYVGQSKDVHSRINNHKDSNKSNFTRCFILSSGKKDADWRGYLDYMESYAINLMEELGYQLENTRKPNPKDDVLQADKKELANEWIDEFLSFLPILGFRKQPIKQIQQPVIIQEEKTIHQETIEPILDTLPLNIQNINPISVYPKKQKPSTIKSFLNGEAFTFENENAINNFKKIIEKIGSERIYQEHLKQKIFSKSLIITDNNKIPKFNQSTKIYKLLDSNLYIYECSSTDHKIEILNKIEKIFKCGFVFEKIQRT